MNLTKAKERHLTMIGEPLSPEAIEAGQYAKKHDLTNWQAADYFGTLRVAKVITRDEANSLVYGQGCIGE